MTDLAPLQEAQAADTPPVRLRALAMHLNAEVRQAARRHPQCPQDITQFLDWAEQNADLLTPLHLRGLAELGPYGAALAIRHPQVTDDLLVSLIQGGFGHLVLELRPDRGAAWMLTQARQRPDLLAYLSHHEQVPAFIRQQARRVSWQSLVAALLTGATLSSPAPVDAEAALPGASPAPEGLTEPLAEAPPEISTPETVRHKLRQRRGPIELSLHETLLIQADPRLQRLAARHPWLPVALLGWIDREQPYGQARETLLHRLEAHSVEPDLFARIAQTGDWDLRAALARNPHLPETVRRELGQDTDWWVRAAVAENPEAHPDELTQLAAETDHVTIRENVAAHPHTPGEVLIRLAHDGDPAVRARVARNPSAPPEALAVLATDERYATREAVASHALTDHETALRLRTDSHERVSYVAQLRDAPLDELQASAALATRRRNVRLVLSHGRDTPAAVLDQLVTDRHPDVRAQVVLHARLSEGQRKVLLGDPSRTVQALAQASDEDTPADRLAFMPRHDARMRQALSRNEHTPEPILEELSDDPIQDVRLSVVLNASSPAEALERRLPEPLLRPDIRRHPRYTGKVQNKLHTIEASEAGDPDASPDALRGLSLSDSVKVRARVAGHPNAAQATLEQLATSDQDEQVRQAVAQRQSALPETVQRQLAHDPSVQVRGLLSLRPDLLTTAMLILARTSADDDPVMFRLMERPDAPTELLVELAQSASTSVRIRVARHSLTPLPTLLRLAHDTQPEVHQAILKNEQLDAAVLLQLVRHPKLRLGIARHPRADAAVLRALAYDAGYARYLGLQAWLSRMPFADHPLADRWRVWARGRASRRAFGDLEFLKEVIRHPAATAEAIRFATRLNHPDIAQALQDRRHQQARPAPAAMPDQSGQGASADGPGQRTGEQP